MTKKKSVIEICGYILLGIVFEVIYLGLVAAVTNRIKAWTFLLILFLTLLTALGVVILKNRSKSEHVNLNLGMSWLSAQITCLLIPRLLRIFEHKIWGNEGGVAEANVFGFVIIILMSELLYIAIGIMILVYKPKRNTPA